MPYRRRLVARAFWVLIAASLAAPAAASFHFMQIEQVIGGVCGDSSQQAVQLRMRSGGQNLLGPSRLRAFDAAGANPLLLHDLTASVASGIAGARVLLATSAFASTQGITPDFVLTNPIPPSSLAAGRLTFEDDFGTIYWSLSWGGGSYTGATTGDTTNDADGNFGPSFPGPLPSTNDQALRFQGSFSAASSNNAADYALTSGAATFTTNGGATVTLDCVIFADGFESGDVAAWSSTVP